MERPSNTVGIGHSFHISYVGAQPLPSWVQYGKLILRGEVVRLQESI